MVKNILCVLIGITILVGGLASLKKLEILELILDYSHCEELKKLSPCYSDFESKTEKDQNECLKEMSRNLGSGNNDFFNKKSVNKCLTGGAEVWERVFGSGNTNQSGT